MWKERVDSLVAPCDRRREGESKLTSCLESLERPCDHLDRKLYSWQTRLACELLVFRVLASLPRDSFFFSDPYGIASLLYPKVSTLKNEPLSLPPDSSSLSLFVRFLPLAFLPRMFLLTRYSLDRERKSWELNEYRVPLEGSLSMPTREKRQSSLAKCVIIKRVPPWGSISADSRAGRTLLTIRINGIKREYR